MNWASSRVNARPGKSRAMVVAIKDFMEVLAGESMVVAAQGTLEEVMTEETLAEEVVAISAEAAILVAGVLETSNLCWIHKNSKQGTQPSEYSAYSVNLSIMNLV